jgi:beta-lactamase regulating signal transducer with metallopeptidase domain
MIDFQTLAQVSAGRALNTIAEGVALAGLSWLVVRFLGARSAVVRFAVWFSALLAVASLPFLVRGGASVSWHKPELQLSSAWASYLFFAWGTIAGVLLLRLARSAWQVRRLKRECREIDKASSPELAKIVRQHAGPRNAKLLVSDEVRVPAALGFFRPAVVLPSWALNELSIEELKVVVLHELAHLRRCDDLTNLAQKFLKAVFFFHPAVWWIESRLALEREIACDDAVLERTNAKFYSASLVSLAEKAFAKRTRLQEAFALAQNALGRMRQTSLRIARILDPKRSRTKRSWAPAVVATACLSAIVLIVTPNAPQMISFASTPVRGPSMLTATASVARRVGTEPPVPAIPASLKVSRHRQTPAVIPARAKARHSNKPKVVLAKATIAPPPAELLLVVQTTNADESGSAIWTLCVWRVTNGNSGAAQITERIVISQI